MIIQCPRCSTRWRSQDAPESDNPVFKCGKCHHMWRLFPGAPEVDERAAAASRGRSGGNAPSDNLEFIFPQRRRATPAEDAAPTVAAPVAPPAAEQPAPSASSVSHDAASSPTDDPATAPVTAAPIPSTPDQRDVTVAPAPASLPEADPPIAPARETMPEPADVVDDAVPSIITEPLDRDDLHDDDEYVLGAPDVDEEQSPVMEADDDEEDDDAEPDADLELAPEEDDDLTIGADDFDDDTDDLTLDDEDDGDADRPVTRDVADEERDAGRVIRLEDTMNAAAPRPAFGAICRMFGALIAVHAVLAVVIRADPEGAGTWVTRLPLVGRTLADDRSLAQRIALKNVAGSYHRLASSRQAFVISGEAVNNSSQTVEQIEVAGILYDDSGEVARKTVRTGTWTTLKLADLSEPEIAYLQKLTSKMTLSPGQTTRFSIVFLEPPRGLREYSSAVTSARPAIHAARPTRQDPAPRQPAVG